MFGVFVLPTRKATVCVVDRVRNNQVPKLDSLYQTERTSRLARFHDDYPVPPAEFSFVTNVGTDLTKVCACMCRRKMKVR